MAGFPSLLDFGGGATGDAILPNGYPNYQATNWSPLLQAALDASAGQILYVPPGGYRLAAWSGNAGKVLAWCKSALRLFSAPGATFYVDLPLTDRVTDVLLVEGVDSNAHDASRVIVDCPRIYPFGENPYATRGRHAIVCHGPRISVLCPDVESMGRWAVLFESGDPARFYGATFLPVDGSGYVNSNFGIIGGAQGAKGRLANCGEVTQDGPQGGGVFAHGSDCQGFSATELFAAGCATGFSDGTLSGAAWRSLYGEQNTIGFTDAGVGPGGRWDACWSEDYANDVYGIVTGGNLPSRGDVVRSFGPVGTGTVKGLGNTSKLGCKDWSGPDDAVFVDLPSGVSKAFARYSAGTPGQRMRVVDDRAMGDDENAPQRRRVRARVTADCGIPADPNGPAGHLDAFGWDGVGETRGDHPRGPGLPVVARPWLNTRARSRFRQPSIIIPPGGRVVSSADTPNTNFMRDAINYWPAFFEWLGYNSLPDAELDLDVTLILPTVDDWLSETSSTIASQQMTARAAQLLACPVYIKSPVMVGRQDAQAGTWLVVVANDSQMPQTVDLIWRVEYFQRTSSATTTP